MKLKNILFTCLCCVIVAALAIGGTLAYLTDKDSAVNVMTLGNVDIEQIEQERDANGSLVDFKQNKPALPAVGSPAWDDELLEVNGGKFKMFDNDKFKNTVDKIVSVKNNGKSDAYFRTIIAIEDPFTTGRVGVNVGADAYIGSDWYTVEIEGVTYSVKAYTYKEILEPGEASLPSLLQAYLNSDTTNEDCAMLGDTWEIMALSQAIQAEGFDDANTALNEGFGEVNAKNIVEWFTGLRPEVEVKGDDAAALTTAINEAPEGSVVTLTEDIDFGANTFTVDKNVVIDLNGKTVSSSTRNGTFYLKNGASLKNGTVQHDGTVAAIKVWQAESIENVTVVLDGKSSSDNVITGISVQEGSNTYIGSIKNVKVISSGDNKTYNGIETYNCGERTDLAIGSMENVTVDVNGTALLLSAPVGTATKCSFKGGVCGINAHLKGAYNVSLKLVDCTVEGPTAVQAWDEPAKTNPGYLKLEAENTTVVGTVVNTPAETFGDRWSVTGLN